MRQDLCRNYKTNIVIIPHGVQAFSKGRLQHDGRTIGFVGRFEHRKGIIPLINAAAILIRNNELRKLTLRGEGPLLKEIHAHIKKAGLELNIVTERPQIGNNDDLFSGIDLLVVPSLLPEGFGLVIIEAMAAGIPVVGSDTTGINEIIIDGYNGRLVPCGDVSALITAIRSIFDDKVFRESLIANGHHTVSMKYKVAMTTSLYCRLMTEL
ncbi:MAG TPA: glycosyltransferase family 4 protein [Nitrosomonas sp.]|nr:glycosyltransferase family 4 protein [Nitrosomonas sp.]